MTTTPPNPPDDSPDDRFQLPPLEGVFEGSAIPEPEPPVASEHETAWLDALGDDGDVDDVDEDDENAEVELASLNEPAPWVDLAEAADAIESIGASEPSDDADFDASEDQSVFAAAAAGIHADDEAPPHGDPLSPASTSSDGDPISVVSPGDEWLPDFLREDAIAATAVATLEPEDDIRAEPLEATRMAVARPAHRPTVARTVAEIPILLIVAAVIAFLVKTFLAQAYYIPSGSMLPQLKIDDRVVVSKLAYKTHDPRRGDIVVFDDPRPGVDTTETVERTGFQKWIRKVGEGVGVVQPSTDEFIKRVIGLPGDHVEGHDGRVYVNNRELREPYLPAGVTTSDFPEQTVADGRLWVMGDNRSGSADSRVFGQIKIDSIVGRAVVKVWPFSHISFL
ncbi:MAG: signal peptidase [Actinomycetota bacterium]|jgi:signal peptidase I